MTMLPARDKVRGMFLGVAIGDALGVPVETFDAERIRREFGSVTQFIQNPTHKWSSLKPAGMWSDDTQLTLAVAESIIETGRLNLESQARWHLRLLDEFGDLGLGGTTRDAFARLRAGVHPSESGRTDNPKRGMGNALPMKISPVGAYLAAASAGNKHLGGDWRNITALTAMTHNTSIAAQSAYAHAYAVCHCLLTAPDDLHRGEFLEAANFMMDLANQSLPSAGPENLSERFRDNILGRASRMTPAEIATYFHGGDPFLVYNSLPVAYACFLRNPNSVQALYDAVAAGGDTDTNSSIAGSLVGALNGSGIFPQSLVNGLMHRDRILDTADRLCTRLGITE